MAVVPVDPDRIITDARDHARAHIWPHRLGIEQLPATHLLDAKGAMTPQAQVADIEVVAVSVLPEHGQRPSVAAANANRDGPRARRPDDAIHPARLSLIAVPLPHKGLQHGRRSGVELFRERGRNGGVRLCSDRLRLVDHDGATLVTAGDDIGIEGYGTQERNPELPAHSLAAAAPEDIGALAAVGAGERAHVLDDPEYGDVHLLEHPQAAAGDFQAYILRRRDDHAA